MSEQVSFGYENVEPEEKTRRVGAVFSNVAAKYDIMNDAMSGGMHRLWKDTFVRRVKPQPGEAILDMAGGTGTLVISEDFTVDPVGDISFTDTVDLVIAGTADAPAFKATSIDVKVDSAVPGLDQIAKSFFRKNSEVPILAGAEQC